MGQPMRELAPLAGLVQFAVATVAAEVVDHIDLRQAQPTAER